MQEIVKLVVDKTGVSPEIAAKAVEVISGYLKSKMPAVGGQLDSLLKGGSGAGDIAGKIAGGLGDMFGKK
jgi:hypothetical protein